AYESAKAVLSENIDLLHAVAQALLDRETLTREDVSILARGEQLPPRPTDVPPSAPPAAQPAGAAEPRRAPGKLFGGPEVAPA
ncbi:MAG TPA: cell division protein FtsH, partial [Gemmatimonadaceae bacterium]